MRLLALLHARPYNLKQSWVGSHAIAVSFFGELGKQGNEIKFGFCKLSRAEMVASATESMLRYGRSDRTFITQNRLAWELKSRRAEKHVRRHFHETDLVVLYQGLFAPYTRSPLLPYVIFTDYNRILSHDRGPFTQPPPWTSEREKQRYLTQEQMLYQQADHIFTASEHVRQSMIMDYGAAPDHVSAVGFGIGETDLFQQAPRRDWTAQKLLFIGEPKSFERKGGPELVAAFKKVRAVVPNATLTLVGPSAEMTGEYPGLNALGVVRDRSKIHALLAESTCFVMPSRKEPFGITYAEAMAARLPVVGASVDAVPEIVQHDHTGLLVSPGDIDALASALINILCQPEVARRMGEAGYARVIERYTWWEVARRVNTVLKNPGRV